MAASTHTTATRAEGLTPPGIVSVHNRLPVSGNAFIDTGTVHCSTVTPPYLRSDTALIDKDGLRRIDTPCFLLPELALGPDSFAVLVGAE